MSEPDVCIIGGGPAGLASAIALRLAGASVVLFELGSPPIDKTCGEGLLPNTVAVLSQLGVCIPASGGHRIRGIRFLADHAQIQADFPDREGLGLRRTLLHSALVNRAAELKVELRWNTKDVRVKLRALSSVTHCFRPKLIVGADGQNSMVRRSGGFTERRFKKRFGFRAHFAVAPWSDHVEIYAGRGKQIYVTPVSPDQVGVALLTTNPQERIRDALPQFPNLQARLESARSISRETGSITASRQLTDVTRPGMALVGDASGSVDAITGEGIGLAVKQAIALGKAFRHNELGIYERAHRRIMRDPRRMERMLLLLSANTFVQSAVMRTLSQVPALVQVILSDYVRRWASIAGMAGSGSAGVSFPNPERLNSQS